MHLTGIIASVLAVTAAAAPNGLVKKSANTTMVNATHEQLAFAIQQAECDVWGCLGVVGAAACIAPKIVDVDVQGVLDCVSGNKEKLCGCASCIAPLGDFLVKYHICDA
ncbi:uncharacterized protein BKCO1_610009 [Diplodia corticola]|uniref:Fungal calcium binding protein domain-containing protein n=1 Tax=Diplodia corticola TaxID=236234 RepID=A0A1J9QNC9_9PEZI|nr:uncharacterized protein BKCO1_610009 [Diplodia corticola]OJD30406.1 hypothetical protein BKCO1_610009 [Diplodia corticola]